VFLRSAGSRARTQRLPRSSVVRLSTRTRLAVPSGVSVESQAATGAPPEGRLRAATGRSTDAHDAAAARSPGSDGFGRAASAAETAPAPEEAPMETVIKPAATHAASVAATAMQATNLPVSRWMAGRFHNARCSRANKDVAADAFAAAKRPR
jgi:hypothetical protein